MTALDGAHFANLLLAGLLTGNEVGTWAVVHPALNTLPFEANLRPEQAITRRYGRFMPALMLLTIGSGILVVSLRPEPLSFALTGAGVLSFGVMLAVTLAGNLPINRRILGATLDTPPPTWWSLRRRWDRLHSARALLDVAGLGFFILGALA